VTPVHRRRTYLYETGRSPFKPVPFKKSLVRAQAAKLRSSREILLDSAEADGYRLGFEDIHTSGANYRSGEEWIAWYKGWKRGQNDRPKENLS